MAVLLQVWAVGAALAYGLRLHARSVCDDNVLEMILLHDNTFVVFPVFLFLWALFVIGGYRQ